MYIDTDKMQWAKYTNPLGARFYTAEEMHQMQMEIIAANEEKLKAQQVSYEEMYKRTHPDYNGERIFRTISGGQLYTANEIDDFLYKEMFVNDLVRRLIASIKVVSAEKLIIQFQSGIVMEQEIRYE